MSMGIAQACYCSVCHMETHSIAGSRHRRCGGEAGEAPRKHKPHGRTRGLWQPGELPKAG